MEKVFHLRKDIDNIYKKSFKPLVDDIEKALKTGKPPTNKLVLKHAQRFNNEKTMLLVIDSSELVSPDAKKAHKLKPIKIHMEIGTNRGNVYNPGDGEVHIEINKGVLKIFADYDWDKESILNAVDGENTVFNEISEMKLKGTINHELSHWIRNTQTGHLDKMFKRSDKLIGIAAKKIQKDAYINLPSESDYDWKQKLSYDKIHGDVIKQGQISTFATYYELDAYIHNIIEYKKSMKLKDYNKKKLTDLFVDISAFRGIKASFKKYIQTDIKDKNAARKKWYDWQKHLIKRLDREKLLGKNMRHMDKSL